MKTTSHQRRVQVYVPPKLHSLIVSYCERTGSSQSEAVTEAVRAFFPDKTYVSHIFASHKGTA